MDQSNQNYRATKVAVRTKQMKRNWRGNDWFLIEPYNINKCVNRRDFRRAIEEIQRDTLRASKLAEEVGPSGWRVQTKRTNKRFLANTMKSVLSHNQRTSLKNATESQRKFQELSKRPPKFGTRLHSFQSTDERSTKPKKQTEPNTWQNSSI